MRALSVMTLLAVLILPTGASAQVQMLTATHTYILGDHDSKDDPRQRCLLEAKRKVLEQAGVYIESASEVKDFALTKDKITSFAAAVMQVKDTREDVGFQRGQTTLTLTITAEVDLAEVRKLATRQADNGVQEDLALQKDRLKRLEAQLEAIQKQQQVGQAPGRMPAPPPSDISDKDLQTLHTRAVQGNATAQVELGLRYALGNGVPQDYATARVWYEKAAVQGEASAQVRIGELYYLGQGVPQDYVQARHLFKKAAAQGKALAQLWLGMLYHMGWGVPQDAAQAAKWYQKAAVQGDVNAQSFLGGLYYNGQGVPQDYVQAAKWYQKAAAQGDADAQSNLGMLYAYGEGMPQDYAMARQWHEKAAGQGNARAQLGLAWLYASRNGDPVDDMRAYMWFNLAAEHLTGNEQKLAEDGRDKIAARMTPAQFAEAQRLASRCQAQHFKGC